MNLIKRVSSEVVSRPELQKVGCAGSTRPRRVEEKGIQNQEGTT